MGGTILNMITVFIGGSLGLLMGNRFPEKMQTSVITGLGLVTFFVGIDNTGKTGNIIVPMLSILFGVIIGELIDIDGALTRFAAWLQAKVGAAGAEQDDAASARERFIVGFVTASLVFCVGPLTFVGSIQDGMGLRSGFEFLAIKSVLDMFAGMAFAASFGIGVMFSIITILLLQGGLALFGGVLVQIMNDPAFSGSLASNPMIIEMTAVGGLLLMGLALVLLDIKKPRVANFLPALVIAPLIVAIAQALGIPIYPL